ncbi:MAG: hypothetical protein WCA95_13410 [Opitutaceae bacterium]
MSDSVSTPNLPPALPAGAFIQADNELDAAKMIVVALKGLQKTQQERAIRYASETLGLSPVQPVPTHIPAHIVEQPSGGHPPDHSAKRAVDIKQFSESKAPKSDNQFAAVVAYYYRFEAPVEQRRDSIDDAVLRDAARLVVRKRPSRMTLNNAKNRGYLDAIGGGSFRINTVGENLVAVTLPNRDDKPRKKAVKNKGSKKAKAKKRAAA